MSLRSAIVHALVALSSQGGGSGGWGAHAATISNPLKAGGDMNKVRPETVESRQPEGSKKYHEERPLVLDVPAVNFDYLKSGDSSCSVEFRLRWATEIESAVLATPVIFPSGPEGKNEIFVNSFSEYVEILGYDGFKPWGWPLSIEEASFQGSPMLYDIDADGTNDIGVVDTDANMYWLRVGEFGQYLEDFHMQVPKLKVRRDWSDGLDENFVDTYVMLSMFDHKDGTLQSNKGKAKSDLLGGVRAPAPSPTLGVKKGKMPASASSAAAASGGASARTESYPELSSRGRKALQLQKNAAKAASEGTGSNAARDNWDAAGLDASFLEEEPGDIFSKEEEESVPLGEGQRRLLAEEDEGDGAASQGEESGHRSGDELAGDFSASAAEGEGGGDAAEGEARQQQDNEEAASGDDYIARFRQQHDNPFGDGGGSYFEGGADGQGASEAASSYYASVSRGRHYMDDLFMHSYYAHGIDMYNESKFAYIDPHVLSSPVLTDIDGDGEMEVIMTVSYYFDAVKYRDVDLGFDISNFVAGGVVSWSLTRQAWNWMVHLDLTTDKTRFKALIYSTPTCADIDGDGRQEIIFGTSLGLLYVIDGDSGFTHRYFPMQFHEIQSQVAVADVAGDLNLEIIFGDMGGNVICLSATGELIWDAKVSGEVSQTPTIGDVDGDGDLDVVVTASFSFESAGAAGGDASKKKMERGCHIWAFDAATGAVLPQFPMALPRGSIAVAPVLLVDLHDYTRSADSSASSKMQSKDINELVKLAKNDSDVMKMAASMMSSLGKQGLMAAAAQKSGSSSKVRSHSDPAVPPWIQSSRGHEAPPSPSLQTTSLILGTKSKNVRAGGESDANETAIIDAIERILGGKEKEGPSSSGADSAEGGAGLAGKLKSNLGSFLESNRRNKEAELLKHIRYRANSGSLGLHMIVAAGDGHLYVIDGARGCAERIDVGEHVYSMPLIDDISQDGFLDLVVGTVNGQVMVLETEIPYHPLNTWSSFPKHRGNGFTHGVSGISVPSAEKERLRYSDTFRSIKKDANYGSTIEVNEEGNWLPVTFDIWDARGALYDPKATRYYDVVFTMGTNRQVPLVRQRFTGPGRYTVLVPVEPPDSFLLVVGMTNEHGQYFEDAVYISLCRGFYVWIKYLVSAPVMLLVGAVFLMRGK